MKAPTSFLARLPNIDCKRMAATGASYGGYMAAWVLGHTDRFACIINHAGVNNFYSQFAADLTSYGFTKVLGGTPWENAEGMQRNNPMFYAKNFKTPMLIMHGELDYRVPYGNGPELYGVLQAMSVPSRLVVFPEREPLGAFAAELDLLELRVPELARPLHRGQAHREAEVRVRRQA